LQPSFTASVTWNSVPDQTQRFHNWLVTGSNCAGVSQIAELVVNVAGGACTPMSFSFTPTASNVWGNIGCQNVVTGSTHNYYIIPQHSGSSFPQTYSYVAPGSTNLLTNQTWVVSSSLQAALTASVTWNNVKDSGGLLHIWLVTGSNCAGVSAQSIVQVNTFDFPVSC
jgi:hypothetical protein